MYTCIHIYIYTTTCYRKTFAIETCRDGTHTASHSQLKLGDGCHVLSCFTG